MKLVKTLIAVLLLSSCSQGEEISPVAEDVLFLVLGKMSIYLQDDNDELTLRDHHFVAEIMPKETGKILGGTLTSKNDPEFSLPFNPEGPQFLAHGERTQTPEALHDAHADGTYIFNYQTIKGEMIGQPLTLKKRETTEIMPAPAKITLLQNNETVKPSMIDPDSDLTITWSQMLGNRAAANSELDDLIFVLAFDCFGNNIAHSGRPYNGKPYLTYKDTSYTIPSTDLKSGLAHQIIVEQATADTERHQGVPGIATYATLTILNASTSGQADGESCPAK